MSAYAAKPWLALYREGTPAEIRPEHDTALALFDASVRRAPDAVLIRYFDGALTVREADEAANALAAALADDGFAPGDRLALFTQNNPAYVIGLIAAWKAGGTAVSINPMNRARELNYLLADSGATALLALDELYAEVARDVIADGGTAVRTVVTTSALDWQNRDDPRLFGSAERRDEGVRDLADLVARPTRRMAATPKPSDPAVLTYTSGTTGIPKGAINTHRNLVFNAQTYRDWIGLGETDTILGIAPLFHITGLVGHVMLALLLPAPLVLSHRFQPAVMLDAIREHQPTFTIGAITAFTALAGVPEASREDFASLTAVYSGGAAIAPAVAESLENQLGIQVHNAYGLTETSSPSHCVPRGVRAPVDPASGALSVGVPVFNTVVRVLDEAGAEVPAGQIGELATSGPQVVPGYWNKPDATAESLPGGELRTGDVGFMDEHGWFYVVDRKKDMINAAGYKVWPREVEDVLYTHPAVRETAVVGVPDPYRGETVKAYVSLNPGASASAPDLVAYAKERMAAYKYPRIVEFLDEIPKNASGKILRRELRDRSPENPVSERKPG
ncbi:MULTISPECIES: AMP-binding protein [Amycolatopsis]|uniref:AMP-binding protein n=1 Tax=Amycolatopsis dendrobii TaxID=2760662 RepID=A0A7W3VZT0_9PSEU|nr:MULTISPECIES: AMP-binding protein [Amycolatopsis]MBB1156140.1 AMP-binding protein [Amycolatopsis dendrobii]UKD58667.1 AMP-binding protein [Amycolatopsis sp. FU40]